MTIDIGPWPLPYLGYLVWLGAGSCDFLCHRRTDLANTSGVAESSLHLTQLALIGAGILSVLVFEMNKTMAVVTFALVIAHAVVGYMDTRSAFGRRTILPLEQHIHSLLDMAPPIAWTWLIAAKWPSITVSDWSLRRAAMDWHSWMWVLLPAIALCCLPALLEFRAAWSARTPAHDRD